MRSEGYNSGARRRTEGPGKEAGDTDVAVPVQGVTIDLLKSEFERVRKRWRDSEKGREVVERIVDLVSDRVGGVEGGVTSEDGTGKAKSIVDKAVGVAMGSFSGEMGDRMRCVWQLVAFVEIVDACTYKTPPNNGSYVKAVSCIGTATLRFVERWLC